MKLKKGKKIPLYRTFERLEPFGAARYKKVQTDLKGKSVFNRFKEIDGPIYKQNLPTLQRMFPTKDLYQTSTRSGHILLSGKAPPPKDRRKDLKEDLQQRNTFDPQMALRELEELQAQYKAQEFAKMKMREGKQSELIAKILEKQKLEIIRDLNLSLYLLSQQRMILESIEGLSPQELSLRFSPLVTFPYLKRINLQNLQSLDLRGCNEVSDGLLVYLQMKAPAIRVLNLSQIKNLRKYGIKKAGQDYSLIFPNLEVLSLSGCENLEEICLKAPTLQQLRVNRCKKLRTFDVEAPNLLFLSGLDSPQSSEEALAFPLLAMMKYPKLRYEEFMDEQKSKNTDSFLPKRFLKTNIIMEFKNVNFSYEQQFLERPILEDISFQLKINKKLAIVGPSGAGKSMIARLLERVVDVSSGSILINNHNIKEFALKDLRTFIGVVSPQPQSTLRASIYDNIVGERRDVSMEDVIRASKAAYIHEFIEVLPNGYNTLLNARLSWLLSRKIAIARLILKKPLILVLDETSTGFDVQAEENILDSFDNFHKPFSIIIITYHLRSIVNVDEIIYINRGMVEERGTHEDLIKLNRGYASLWKKISK